MAHSAGVLTPPPAILKGRNAAATTLISLIRGRLPSLLSALRRRAPWSLWLAAGFVLAAFSKTIDGLARKLASWGIDVSRGIGRGAGTLEELLELLIPIFFMIAIFLRSGETRS